VIDDLRAFLDRPLEPGVARAVLAIAATVTIGFLAVLALAGVGGRGDLSAAGERDAGRPSAPPASAPRAVIRPTPSGEPSVAAATTPRQDPQDRRGTPAHRRAAKAAREHRALQHLPYRRGRLEIELVGAERARAILRVSAPTREGGKRGWRRFLRRFHDTGASYRPVFVARRQRP
jgi:hypothetical protein